MTHDRTDRQIQEGAATAVDCMDDSRRDGSGSRDPAAEVRERVRSEFGGMLADLVDAGRGIAASWEEDAVRSGEMISAPLEEAIHERGLAEGLLESLVAGAATLDSDVQGRPVPAPPYLVVTSRGPLCRGTLADGRRLVVAFVLFEVDRRPRRYRFLDPRPEGCLEVGLR
jgi:hypothetical protein